MTLRPVGWHQVRETLFEQERCCRRRTGRDQDEIGRMTWPGYNTVAERPLFHSACVPLEMDFRDMESL